MAETSIEWTKRDGTTGVTWNPSTGSNRTPRSLPGEMNPNWRGGHTVTQHGYVLVKAPGHPGADVRGYVYEHRLVLESKLGRLLQPEERARHIDGNPGNNDPSNIELRRPTDRQKTIRCACGCGATMTEVDQSGRRRRFKSGHNSLRGVRPGGRPARETGARLDVDLRERLTEAFEGLCAYGCGDPATAWDHLIPWSLGGSFDRAGNAVPACATCNAKKNSAPDIWPWIEKGVRSGLADAWEGVISLGISWGDLDSHDGWMAVAS